MHAYGSDGSVQKKSGQNMQGLTYILMDHVSQGSLYDFCQASGALGEDVGRYFMNQLIDSIQCMQEKNVVHRDLKPENILLDENLNIKLTDFGFATYHKIDRLKSFKGTYTYMAPEILNEKTYNGM